MVSMATLEGFLLHQSSRPSSKLALAALRTHLRPFFLFSVCPSAEVPSCHSVYLRQDGYLAHANRTEGTDGPRDPLLLTLNGC